MTADARLAAAKAAFLATMGHRATTRDVERAIEAAVRAADACALDQADELEKIAHQWAEHWAHHNEVGLANFARMVLLRMQAQAAELARMREALRPFVTAFAKHRAKYDRRGDAAAKWFEDMPGHWPTELVVTMDDCREASALLAQHQPQEAGS